MPRSQILKAFNKKLEELEKLENLEDLEMIERE
jgi:hypothetical protein